MARTFGRLAGRIYLHCDDDRTFRDALDKLLTNEIAAAANPRRLLIEVDLGDYPDSDDTSTDLARVTKILDVLAQLGSITTDEAGWQDVPRDTI